jgi:hypothetical protein
VNGEKRGKKLHHREHRGHREEQKKDEERTAKNGCPTKRT